MLPFPSERLDLVTAADLELAEGLTPETFGDKKASAKARKAAMGRSPGGRRRCVDPATCERDYSGSEMEFLQAMQAYKQSSGRMFPTWSEVLEVVRGLGYEKAAG